MNNKTYLGLVSVIFSVIAVLHLLRIVQGWEIVFNGYTLPMWISWIGVLLAGFLAFYACKAYKKL